MDFRRLKYYRHNSLILITSGDRDLLDAIAPILTAEKFNFITETDGEKAWEIILHKKPAIVLADWNTPNISGLALCHRIKSSLDHPELAATYFILMIAADTDQQSQIGLDTGVDEFLCQPLNPAELRTRLRTGLRSCALIQSLTWTNQRLLAQNALLEVLDLSDPLTKVLSEQAFAEIMPRMMQQFQEFNSYESYRFLSVLIINIDIFKQITHSYGVQIGSETLQAIAGRLSHSCAAHSLLYRYGRDEFTCVTPHTEIEQAEQLANDLLISIRSHPIAVSSGLLFPMTISIGGVVETIDKQEMRSARASTDRGNAERINTEQSLHFSDLLKVADDSLMQAKKSGGNRAFIEQMP